MIRTSGGGVCSDGDCGVGDAGEEEEAGKARSEKA